MDEDAAPDAGFTLVELLVVMIIIGVLAAVAVPTFLSQRAKAHDAATKADVSNLGKEVAAYWVGGTGPLTLDYSVAGQVRLMDALSPVQVSRITVGSVPPPGAGEAFRDLDSATAWCVSLIDPQGDRGAFRYTALAGLEAGTCA